MSNTTSNAGKQSANTARSQGPRPQRQPSERSAPIANPALRSIADLQRTAGNRAVVQGIGAYSRHERQADQVAQQALDSSKDVREFFASRFGLNAADVQVHTDERAAESARALHAKAYTVGRDVYFGDGRYAPGEPEGQRLLAHELAHVVQQRDLQTTFVQRAPDDDKVPTGEFGPKYKLKKARSLSYEDYQANIGKNSEPPIQAASKFTDTTNAAGNPGTKISPIKITLPELKEILNPPGPGNRKEVDPLLEKYLDEVNLAFQTGQLDTAESQALYLAHSAGETGSFSKLDEKTVQAKEYQKKGFEGRGPVQVTGEYNYVQTLAYLEKDAEILRKSSDPEDRYRAARAQEAVDAIKKNPKNASNPRYTFLFSAAFMQMAGGVRRSPQLQGKNPQFPGDSAEDNWVGGNNNQSELDAATTRLKAARDALKTTEGEASPDPKVLAAKKAAVTKEQNAVQEWTSTVRQGRVKAATFKKAMEVLRKKKVTKQKP